MPAIQIDSNPGRSSAHVLWRKLAAIVFVKLIALVILYQLFFSAPHRSHVDARCVQAQILSDASTRCTRE